MAMYGTLRYNDGIQYVYTYYTSTILGKDRDAMPEKGLAHNVVINLISQLPGKRYHLYMHG